MNNQTNIQVFGDKYTLEDGAGVYIENVDVSQVVAEMYHGDVLDAIDFGDIIGYVAEKNAEEADE